MGWRGWWAGDEEHSLVAVWNDERCFGDAGNADEKPNLLQSLNQPQSKYPKALPRGPYSTHEMLQTLRIAHFSTALQK